MFIAYQILKINCAFAVAVTRPLRQAEQRSIKEEQIAAEQKLHETKLLTDHKSSEPLRS